MGVLFLLASQAPLQKRTPNCTRDSCTLTTQLGDPSKRIIFHLTRPRFASPELIAAYLLHDLGHRLHDLPEAALDHGIDDEHEQLWAAWLVGLFVPEVVEPIRLHFAAKRYLCAVDPEYFAKLSPPSIQSLVLQGGPMTKTQADHFELHPHFEAAIQLRRIDDVAKIPGLSTPPLSHFAKHLSQSLIGRSES